MVPAQTRLAPLDVLRGFTILSVVAYHFHADTAGLPGQAASFETARAAFLASDFGGVVESVARAIVGQPGFRLDLLLFVTGIVLSLGTAVPAAEFFRRRARAVLPNYVAGSLCAALLLVGFAAVRSGLGGTSWAAEVHHGTLLGRRTYAFEWTDVVRSMSIVGRLESPRAMQVVAPSLWYLMLVAQLYVFFPWLRRWLARSGPVVFLAGCSAVTWGARWAAFHAGGVGQFNANETVIHFLPPRLIAPALGMVAAASVARWTRPLPVRSIALWTVPLGALFLAATWLGVSANQPGTGMGLVGPIVPLALGVPAVWLLACTVSQVPSLARVMTWTGQRSLSLLVAQDFVRLGVGTLLARGIRLQDHFWMALPIYLAVALLATRAWHPVPEWLTTRVSNLREPRAAREPVERVEPLEPLEPLEPFEPLEPSSP